MALSRVCSPAYARQSIQDDLTYLLRHREVCAAAHIRETSSRCGQNLERLRVSGLPRGSRDSGKTGAVRVEWARISPAKEQCNENAETEPRGGVQGEGSLAALKGDRTLPELAEKYDVHGSQITQWKTQLLEGAIGVFLSPAEKRGGESGPSTKDMQAKIGQLTLENDFSYG